MGMYKVWSMSSNSEQSDFYIEYETRVDASNEEEAKNQVRERFFEEVQETPESWDWMAVKLP